MILHALQILLVYLQTILPVLFAIQIGVIIELQLLLRLAENFLVFFTVSRPLPLAFVEIIDFVLIRTPIVAAYGSVIYPMQLFRHR